MFYYWLVYLKCFWLDSAHDLLTSGYTWDAIKRFTCVRLKLISDIEKYQFIESMLKRGILWFLKVMLKLTIDS